MVIKEDFLSGSVRDPRVDKAAISLKKAGYDVHIIIRNAAPDVERIRSYGNIPVIVGRLPPKLLIPKSSISRKIAKKAKLFLCAKEIIDINPDIIHIHEENILHIGVLAKLLSGKPLVYDAHEDYVRYIIGRMNIDLKENRSLRKVLHYKIQILRRSFTEAFFIKHFVDHVITVNSFLENKYSKWAPTSIVMNSRSINDLPKSSSNDILDQFDIAKEQFKVIFVTKYYNNWGFETVFEASKLLPEGYQIIVVCPLRDELKSLIKEYEPMPNVIFTDAVSKEGVMELIANSDVGIIPLPYDPNTFISTPNKIFEYMLGGIPIISSNFPEIEKIIKNDNCGLLIKPEDPEELAKAIIYLKNNEEKRINMGNNGKKANREKYNWEIQERRLLGVYDKLLKNN